MMSNKRLWVWGFGLSIALILVLSIFLVLGAKTITEEAKEKMVIFVSLNIDRVYLQNLGINIIEDYGSFVLADVSEKNKEILMNNNIELMSASSLNKIYLKNGIIDTSVVGTSKIQSSTSTGYHIIHFKGPVKEEWKQNLISRNVRILEYLPNNAYIVKSSSLSELQSQSNIDYIGAYLPSYKISEELLTKTEKVPIRVTLFNGANVDSLINDLYNYGAEYIKVTENREWNTIVTATLDGTKISSLSQNENILWISEKPEYKLMNDVARGIMTVGNVWSGLGLYGSNQIVGVADTGLDTGSLSTIHRDFGQSGSSSNPLRVKSAFAWGRQNDWSDTHGHGTHVAGSILGNGYRSGSNPGGNSYSSSFAGVAPKAQLVFQSVMDANGGLGGLPNDLNQLFQQAYSDGARIHSNSWGAPVSGQYDTEAQQVDQFMWSNKDFVILFAAGNGGSDSNRDGVIDTGSVSSPGTAKNDITVGATESVRSSGGYSSYTWGAAWPSNFPTEPIKSDKLSDNSNGMAAFSSRGPARDGRIEPTVSAPGTNIISVRSQNSQAGTGWGAYDQYYVYMGGTSMATPLAAGATALVREYYTSMKNIASPSAALIKATIMNGAFDMTPGQYGTGSTKEMNARPNNVEGWGRVDLGNTLNPASGTFEFKDFTSGLTTGQNQQYTYSISSSSIPLKVTLVWTDYPGSTSASKALVNDLDLTVTSPSGTTYYGNGGSSADRTNNAEEVDISSPATGTYTIKVTGFNVPQGPQPFALIVRGALGSAPPPSGIQISNIAVSGITQNSATVTWNTNIDGSSVVEYGTTTSYGSTATGASGTSHTVSLSGLQAGTTYHFRVKSVSTSNSNDVATSGDNTFTTQSAGTTVYPLSDGVPMTKSLSAAGDKIYFNISIPSGKTELKVEGTGPSGADYDYYVKLGALPSTSDYGWKDDSSSKNGLITIANPLSGNYYIMVYSYSGNGSFTIKATTASGGSGTTVTPLTDGIAKSSSLSAKGESKYFSIDVPSGKTSLKIELDGPSGADFDLYVKLDSLPSKSSYNYKSTSSQPDETIDISNPSAGTWYIMVYSYSGTGSFTIKATTSTGIIQVTDLQNGVPASGSLSATGAKSYFKIVVPNGKNQLKIILDGPSGADFDLYVKRGALPTTSVFDYRAWTISSDEQITIGTPTNDTYYIMVISYQGSGSFTLTATYS